MTNTYFTILPADVRYDKRLLANEKIIYSEILFLSQKKGYCHATNAYFAEVLSASVTSVSKWINKLIKLSYIKMEYKYLENTRRIEERRLFITKNEHELANDLKEDIEEDFKVDVEAELKGDIERDFKGDIKADLKDNKTSINNTSMNKTRYKTQTPIELWNTLGGKIGKIKDTCKYQSKINSLIKTYGEDDLISTIKSIEKSKFLKGEVADFVISLPWFLNNYEKIRSGAYDDWAKTKANKNLGKFSKSQAENPSLAHLARARRLARMKGKGRIALATF